MKTLTLLATVLLLSAFSAQANQKNVYVNANDALISSTRNPQQETMLILQGYFPNTCYEWVRGEVTHFTEFTHQVRGVALVNQGICLMVFVEFEEHISLGQLLDGNHTLTVMNGDGTSFEKEFEVK